MSAHETAAHDDPALRVEALEALLVEKGLVDPDVVDDVIEHYETSVGPLNGAKVVARAWSDAQYRERLLADATKAVAELGFGGTEAMDESELARLVTRDSMIGVARALSPGEIADRA